jgi:hypothetical protein
LVQCAEIVESLFGYVGSEVEGSVFCGHDGDAATDEVFGVRVRRVVVAEEFEVVGEDVVDNMRGDAAHGLLEVTFGKVGHAWASKSCVLVGGTMSFAFAGFFLVERPERYDLCAVSN